MPADDVLTVLAAYPQVYHACHRRHVRSRGNPDGLSARDAWILGHLHRTRPISPSRLARHMALGASTVSEAVSRLERLGCINRRRSPGDRRRIELLLSARGAEAMARASVLDAGRVRQLLALLPDEARARAVDGLALLAEAARTLNAKDPGQWDDDEE